MDQIQTAENLASQVRAKLLQELLDLLTTDRSREADRLVNLEGAAHILNQLDPARSGSLVGSYATLKAEQTTP